MFPPRPSPQIPSIVLQLLAVYHPAMWPKLYRCVCFYCLITGKNLSSGTNVNDWGCPWVCPTPPGSLNTWTVPQDSTLLFIQRALQFIIHPSPSHSLGSVVGIATGYGLDGPGIESRWGRDFPHLSRPALKPAQPPVQWVPGISRG